MKRKIRNWIWILAALCVLVLAGYIALLRYYQIKIPYGTWLNGIYCTGKTYDEAATLLLEANEYVPELKVVDVKGNSHKLVLPEDTYALSYRDGLEEILSEKEVFQEKRFELMPTILVDEEKFEQYILLQPVLAEETVLSGSDRLEIVKNSDGFHLVDKFEDVLDVEKAKAAIYDAFVNGEKILFLPETDCYYKPAYTEADEQIKAQYIKLLEFCDTFTMEISIEGEIVYTVDASVLKDWLLTNKDGSYATKKDGSYQLDKSKVKEYANQISKEVTTYFGKPWQFVNHNGETIEVKAGNYGRALQINKLYNTLLNAFEKGTSDTYELEFTFHPKSAEEIDYGAGIGSSYVEVDINEQKIFLYLDGELTFTSDCVTGDVRKHYDTPKGVFYIEYKQRNRVLKGEDYRTPVNYWMHFYNHCGFHDATWRKTFGESIYLTDGSHGCINMPYDKAKEMYELAYKGMPVVVY